MKKILVLGGSGMAGHTISLYFIEKGYDVTVFTQNKVSFANSITGDITAFDKTKEVVLNGNYDVVINAIGLLNEYANNNKAKAVILNSYLPHFLADITKNSKTKVIQMSTDCVFSGKTGGYKENSLRDGITFYDRSKALGELENNKDLTFRNSIIGPDINEGGIGLFNWFMKQEGEIFGYNKAIWTGVTTLTLAKAMEAAIEENLTGLYNLVNNEIITKYEMLKLFNKYFKNNTLKIIKQEDVTIDKSLVNTRKDFSFKVPSYIDMIIEMKEWVIKYQNLYQHYEVL